MADVGHAAADEHLIDRLASFFAQQLDVVGVVGASQDRLGDLVEVDLDHGGVFGIGVGLEQHRIGQPGLHRLDAAGQGAGIAVAAGDHVFEQRHIAAQVLAHGLDRQLDRAAGAAALGRGIGQLKGLLEFEIGQPLDLHDAAVEDVLLALLSHRQQALLDGHIGNRVDHIAQGHTRLQRTCELHQHRLGHVQRHGADGGGKGHQT